MENKRVRTTPNFKDFYNEVGLGVKAKRPKALVAGTSVVQADPSDVVPLNRVFPRNETNAGSVQTLERSKRVVLGKGIAFSVDPFFQMEGSELVEDITEIRRGGSLATLEHALSLIAKGFQTVVGAREDVRSSDQEHRLSVMYLEGKLSSLQEAHSALQEESSKDKARVEELEGLLKVQTDIAKRLREERKLQLNETMVYTRHDVLEEIKAKTLGEGNVDEEIERCDDALARLFPMGKGVDPTAVEPDGDAAEGDRAE